MLNQTEGLNIGHVQFNYCAAAKILQSLGHVLQLPMQLGHVVRSRISEAVWMQKLRYCRCDLLCRKQRLHFELQTAETTMRCIGCLASRKTDKALPIATAPRSCKAGA